MTKAESAASGLRNILVATAIAGILGYVVQLLAPALLASDESYITFSVYWSTMYLFVAALSGVQQEITRGAREVDGGAPRSPLGRYTIIVAAVSLSAVIVMAALLGPLILPGSTVVLAAALGVGVIGYILVAVLGGVLYGLRLWAAVAALTISDALFRAVLVVVGLLAGWSAELIAFAISIPFGLAFLAVWLGVRRAVSGRVVLDVPLRRMLTNTLGTVLAAAAMGVLMNGLPTLLGITSREADPAVLAGLILAITVTRAPIVVPLLALQSYFLSILRGRGPVLRRRIFIALGVTAAGVAVLSCAAALVGPWAIGVISGGRFTISAAMMATITAGAGLVAMMCITGPALLAQDRHVPYAAGWVVAAALTPIALLLPIALDARVALTLLVPPVVGLTVHLVAIWQAPGTDRAMPLEERPGF
ncbi:MAG: hypothetical protein ABW091_13635 [Microbacterium sp.]